MSAALVPPQTRDVETISQTTLSALGISAADAERWMQVAAMSEIEFAAYAAVSQQALEDKHQATVKALVRGNGSAPYRPRSVDGKRHRRTDDELDDLLQVVRGLLAQQSGTISIRHLFYLVVSAGAVEKTERGYQNLKHLLSTWRRSGAIDWSAFSDSTRWYYGNPGHRDLRALLEENIRTCRFNIWEEQAVHVEIWAEKDAIASILLEAADPWRVQVFPFRGFASLTSLYNAAENFRVKQAEGKKVFVYYFGDHDPSGVAIDPAAVAALRDDFGVEVNFQRVAVTEEQIDAYGLPTRPTKATDSRAKGFTGGSVEIDAMPRDVLLALVEDCITQHLPEDAYTRMVAGEREQRASLNMFLNWYDGERSA